MLNSDEDVKECDATGDLSEEESRFIISRGKPKLNYTVNRDKDWFLQYVIHSF